MRNSLPKRRGIHLKRCKLRKRNAGWVIHRQKAIVAEGKKEEMFYENLNRFCHQFQQQFVCDYSYEK